MAKVMLHFCVIMIFICYAEAASAPTVQLNSTLFNGDTAYDEQQINFTCITNSTDGILTWRSEHYIGLGNILQSSYYDPLGSTDSNLQNPSTVATLISATSNGGVMVIESQLQITASMQNPNSNVSCQINSNGRVKTIPFRVSPPTVTLTSTLHKGNLALDEQQVNFTCIITSTDGILKWRSEHYIVGDLQISFHDHHGFTESNLQIPSTVATLINTTSNGGVMVIESRLRITASMQNPNSSVSCQINSNGTMNRIAFQTVPELPTGAVSISNNESSGGDGSSTERVTEDGEQQRDDFRTTWVIVVITFGVAIVITVVIISVLALGIIIYKGRKFSPNF